LLRAVPSQTRPVSFVLFLNILGHCDLLLLVQDDEPIDVVNLHLHLLQLLFGLRGGTGIEVGAANQIVAVARVQDIVLARTQIQVEQAVRLLEQAE
jgi:hypothetical protein